MRRLPSLLTAVIGLFTAPLPGQTPVAGAVATQSLQITARVVPHSLYGRAPSQLFVQLKNAPTGPLKVVVSASRGFRAVPAVTQWSKDHTGTLLYSGDLVADDATSLSLATGTVSIAAQDSAGAVIDNTFIDFEFQPFLNITTYLLLGSIGIAVGYIVRIIIKRLGEIQPPHQLALAAENPTGFRAYLLRFYYIFDFAVTLVVGLLVLISMMKQGRPPANAPYWHDALMIGFGLGLLTNSELLTKVK